MNNSEATILPRVAALPIRARAAFALAVAEMAVADLAQDPQGLTFAQQALGLSWQWVSGAPVKAGHMDEHIDGHGDNFTHYLRRYRDKKPMHSAICAVSLAVAYTGRHAYAAEGSTSEQKMSEPMAEVTEEIMADLLGDLRRTSRYDEAALQRVVGFLTERYAGQAPDEMGGTMGSEEMLPLIS